VEQLDVTLLRGLKVWWSFAWRSMVLFFVVVFPLEILGMIIMMRSMPQPGTKVLDPSQAMLMASVMVVAWPILMALVVVLQAQGMRWMLRKARWSDFRIAVLPPDR
jgi:hypothetical protein